MGGGEASGAMEISAPLKKSKSSSAKRLSPRIAPGIWKEKSKSDTSGRCLKLRSSPESTEGCGISLETFFFSSPNFNQYVQKPAHLVCVQNRPS